MRELPILFNGAMVRAILSGQKTQTRRVMKHQLQSVFVPGVGPMLAVQKAKGTGRWLWPNAHDQVIGECPHGQPGDRLWVRESFIQGYPIDPHSDRLLQFDTDGNELPMTTWYRATDQQMGWEGDSGWQDNPPWRPSVHMPRSLCRLVLEITAVRVERLQAISEADALAEGIEEIGGRFTFNGGMHESLTPQLSFQTLWDSTGGQWAANPWVWVIEFNKINEVSNG